MLVFNSWFNTTKQVLHVNYEYTDTEVADNMIMLNNMLSVTLQLTNNNFTTNYGKMPLLSREYHTQRKHHLRPHVRLRRQEVAVRGAYDGSQTCLLCLRPRRGQRDRAQRRSNTLRGRSRGIANNKNNAQRHIDEASYITKEWLLCCLNK